MSRKIPLCLLLLGFLLARLLADDTQDYMVRKGDTVYSLARYYGVAVSEILRLNGLENSHPLVPGMLLKIPDFPRHESLKSNYGTHVVAAGETFYAIARRYAMPLSELLQLNGLAPNALLKQGQTLVVKTAEHSGYWPVSGRREMLQGKLQGVRIVAPDQSLVYAVRAGKVVWQGPYRSYGLVVLVASGDGYIYLYGGNVHFLVNTGEDIRKGQPLGQVDSQVGNQLAGQSRIYQGHNRQLSLAKQNPSQVYFSVFRDGEFVPLQDAPRD